METPPERSTTNQEFDFLDYSPEHLSNLKKPGKALSKKQAISLIGQIHETLEDYMLRLRWCLGFVIANTDRPFGYGRQTIEEIIREFWNQYQIRANRTLLYECEKLYRVVSGNFDSFLAWIAEQKAFLHRPVIWADVQRLCLGGRNNPDVIAPIRPALSPRPVG